MDFLDAKWIYLNLVIITFCLFWSHIHTRKNIEYLTVIHIQEEYAHDENN